MEDAVALLDAAAALMRDGAVTRAMEAFHAIAAAFPAYRGVCLAQIGVGEHRLGHFHRAIQFYEAALKAGAEPSMMQDNLDAARDGVMWRDFEARARKANRPP